MASWSKIGAQCVCIDAHWSPENSGTGRIPDRSPQQGETLTVAGLVTFDGGLFLAFDEIPNTGSDGGWYFRAEYFRPLLPIERDQELFASWLRSVPAPHELGETV